MRSRRLGEIESVGALPFNRSIETTIPSFELVTASVMHRPLGAAIAIADFPEDNLSG